MNQKPLSLNMRSALNRRIANKRASHLFPILASAMRYAGQAGKFFVKATSLGAKSWRESVRFAMQIRGWDLLLETVFPAPGGGMRASA